MGPAQCLPFGWGAPSPLAIPCSGGRHPLPIDWRYEGAELPQHICKGRRHGCHGAAFQIQLIQRGPDQALQLFAKRLARSDPAALPRPDMRKREPRHLLEFAEALGRGPKQIAVKDQVPEFWHGIQVVHIAVVLELHVRQAQAHHVEERAHAARDAAAELGAGEGEERVHLAQEPVHDNEVVQLANAVAARLHELVRLDVGQAAPDDGRLRYALRDGFDRSPKVRPQVGCVVVVPVVGREKDLSERRRGKVALQGAAHPRHVQRVQEDCQRRGRQEHEEHVADHVERFADGLDEKRHEKDADGQATPHEVVGILGGVREGSLFFVVVDMFHGRERMQAHDSAASVVSGQRWEKAPLLSTASVRSVDYTKKTHIIIYMYM